MLLINYIKQHSIMRFFITITTICLFLAGCSSNSSKKGEPTPLGELFTIEQIQTLPQDSSKNGQLISIEGYAMSCSMMKMIKLGKKNTLTLRTSPDCKDGQDIIMAQIYFSSNKNSSVTFGSSEEPRNFFIFEDDKSFSAQTDDYQKIKADGTKLIFSGILSYNDYLNKYELDVKSIHQPK